MPKRKMTESERGELARLRVWKQGIKDSALARSKELDSLRAEIQQLKTELRRLKELANSENET